MEGLGQGMGTENAAADESLSLREEKSANYPKYMTSKAFCVYIYCMISALLLFQAAKKAETLFQLIDIDKDGTLTEQEFLRVGLKRLGPFN
jgi:hypothetical protein